MSATLLRSIEGQRPAPGRRPGKENDEASRRKVMEIAEAALQDFAEKGFDGTTFAGIARRLGVTQPLIHYYFGCKESLWRHAVELVFSRLNNVTEAAAEDGSNESADEALKILVRRLIYFMSSNPELHQIWMRESSTRGERLDWMAKKHIAPLFRHFDDTIERGVREGTLRRVPRAAFIILGASFNYIDSAGLRAALYGPEHADLVDDRLREYADEVVEFCFSGISARAATNEGGSWDDRDAWSSAVAS